MARIQENDLQWMNGLVVEYFDTLESLEAMCHQPLRFFWLLR